MKKGKIAVTVMTLFTIAALIGCAGEPKEKVLAEENKAIVRHMIEEWNKGNTAVMDDVMAPDCVIHGADGKLTSSEEAKPFYEQLRRAFPDLHSVIEDLIAEGDKVVARYTESGTMKENFMGMEATGKRFTIPSIEIYRFANGKIAEVWEVRDMATLMQQLGVAPSMGP